MVQISSSDTTPPSCGIWPWCELPDRHAGEIHQHQIGPAWREHPGGPELRVVLEAHDDDARPHVAISYSSDGVIADGFVALPLAGAAAYASSILQAIGQAKLAVGVDCAAPSGRRQVGDRGQDSLASAVAVKGRSPQAVEANANASSFRP